MDCTDSRSLVLLARQGDGRALDELVTAHLPGLRAYVRLRCGPALRARESASDIAQSVCRDVLENLEHFRWNGEAGFKAWLYATALRKIADRAHYWEAQKRDMQREVALPEHGVGWGPGEASGETPLAGIYGSIASPSQLAVGRERLEQLEAAFDLLTDEQREVIALAKVAGLTHGELAERLQCTPATARQRLFRALSALSQRLDPDGGETAD